MMTLGGHQAVPASETTVNRERITEHQVLVQCTKHAIFELVVGRVVEKGATFIMCQFRSQ